MRPDQFGSANTQSTEPPSGTWISAASVASAFCSLDPLPTATATYCLPPTAKLIGNDLITLFGLASHSTFPVVSPNARNMRSSAPANTTPPPVASTALVAGARILYVQ